MWESSQLPGKILSNKQTGMWTGRRDMTETLLKLALNPNQSIKHIGVRKFNEWHHGPCPTKTNHVKYISEQCCAKVNCVLAQFHLVLQLVRQLVTKRSRYFCKYRAFGSSNCCAHRSLSTCNTYDMVIYQDHGSRISYNWFICRMFVPLYHTCPPGPRSALLCAVG